MSGDERILRSLRSMWEQSDPCPADLAERSLVRMALHDLDIEIMAIGTALSAVGSRSSELASTVIFESQSLSLTVTISPASGRRLRLDGWITPSAALVVRLHGASGVREETADEDGRFAFVDVTPGHVRFTVEPTPGAALHLGRPVATPSITI